MWKLLFSLALAAFGLLAVSPVTGSMASQWSQWQGMDEESYVHWGASVSDVYPMEDLQSAIWADYNFDSCAYFNEGTELSCSSMFLITCESEVSYYQESEAHGASPCCVNSPPGAVIECRTEKN